MLHRRSGCARAGAGTVPVPVGWERPPGHADLAGSPPDLVPAARLRRKGPLTDPSSRPRILGQLSIKALLKNLLPDGRWLKIMASMDL